MHLPVAIFYGTFKTDDKPTLACELVVSDQKAGGIEQCIPILEKLQLREIETFFFLSWI